jgi:MFS family permease
MTRRATAAQGVLAERNFRLFLTGYTASVLGASMVPVALTFAVLNEGHPVADVGYVLSAEAVPLVLLLLLGGVLADRFSRKVVMVSTDLARFASQGLLAGLLVSGSPPLWVFMVLSGVLGAGQALFNPALTGLLPELVSAEVLQKANALRGVASSTGGVIGPAVAGVIVAAGGAGWAVAIDAATYAVSAWCLGRLDLTVRGVLERSSMLSQLGAGWREFRSKTWLWAIVVQFGLFNLIAYPPFFVLGAVVARDRLGGARAWGLILAAMAAGSVVGGLGAIRIRPRRPLRLATVATFGFAIPIALLAIPVATAWVAIGALAAGLSLAVFNTLWETTLQQAVPAELLSRVSAYDWLGSTALVPIGFALAGPAAGAFGIGDTLWFGAAWIVVTTLAVLAVPDVRRLRPPVATVANGMTMRSQVDKL